MTQKGQRQAAEAAKFLRSQLQPMSCQLLSSPVSRAAQTAAIIANTVQKKVISIPSFAERKLGRWEGQPWPHIRAELIAGNEPPQGELEADFRTRVRAGYKMLTEIKNKDIIVIAHGGVLYELDKLLGPNLFDTGLGYCGIINIRMGVDGISAITIYTSESL